MKRILSFLLCVLLLVSSVPASFSHAASTKPAADDNKRIANIPVGGTFTLGIWPQSLVEDSALIGALDSINCNLYAYGFAYGSNNTVGDKVIAEGLSYPKVAGLVDMQYGDVIYEGKKYRKVVVGNMRTDYDPAQTSNADNTAFNGTYYFRWDPIEWLVLWKAEKSNNAGDTEVRVIAKNILQYDYTAIEGGAGSTATGIGPNAFCKSEVNAAYSWALSFKNFESNFHYNATDFRAQLYSEAHGYLAPESDYAQLLGAHETFLSGQREQGYGRWKCADDRLVNESGEHVSIDKDAGIVRDQGYRPCYSFRDTYKIQQINIVAYPSEHTHVYGRKLYAPEHLKAAASCSSGEVYYSSCYFCADMSGRTFVAPQNYFEHTLTQVQSNDTLRTAASEEAASTYYYTCSVCGTIVKDNALYFTNTQPHTEHHFYFLSGRSSARCTSGGTAYYRCRDCTYTYSEIVSEGLGHLLDKTQVAHRTNRSEADCSHNATYYYAYKCKRCHLSITDESEYFEVPDSINPNVHHYTVEGQYTAPTCEESGIQYMLCRDCGADSPQIVPALGHDFGEQNMAPYSIKSAATCTEDAAYYYACSRCRKVSELAYTAAGTRLGHDYTKQVMNKDTLRTAATESEEATYFYSCLHCGEVLKNPSKYFKESEYKPYLRNLADSEKAVTFGAWPQTRVSDAELLEQLERLPVKLTSYKYRYTVSYGNYYQYVNMYYADVTFEGQKYRKVHIGSYRPSAANESPSVGQYQEKNGYLAGESYWFKWEPLEWQAGYIGDNQAVLVCTSVIDAQNYITDYARCATATWAESSVRQWLNDTFYESAFSESEKEDILCANIVTGDNADYGTRGGDDTKDKVYIAAKEEVNTIGHLHYATASDYALSQGLRCEGSEDAAWMMRTPSYNQDGICYVNKERGVVTDEAHNAMMLFGVRPMLTVSLIRGSKSEDINGDGVLDMGDISLLLAYFGSTESAHTAYDLSGNGAVDIKDAAMVLTSPYYGKKFG